MYHTIYYNQSYYIRKIHCTLAFTFPRVPCCNQNGRPVRDRWNRQKFNWLKKYIWWMVAWKKRTYSCYFVYIDVTNMLVTRENHLLKNENYSCYLFFGFPIGRTSIGSLFFTWFWNIDTEADSNPILIRNTWSKYGFHFRQFKWIFWFLNYKGERKQINAHL